MSVPTSLPFLILENFLLTIDPLFHQDVSLFLIIIIIITIIIIIIVNDPSTYWPTYKITVEKCTEIYMHTQIGI